MVDKGRIVFSVPRYAIDRLKDAGLSRARYGSCQNGEDRERWGCAVGLIPDAGGRFETNGVVSSIWALSLWCSFYGLSEGRSSQRAEE